MASLTPGQQSDVSRARQALTASHQMSIGAATDRDLCHNIGRLEIALDQALRVIDELTEGS
ncbi:hypothetical protein ABZY44_23730 [Streptomyces sp. NPDC006544]|uniref:hypothetical protein n=1 Tax=Streptomyces sp. NPDC006544 TaxID=3154583 RepID=UPI0033A4B4AD